MTYCVASMFKSDPESLAKLIIDLGEEGSGEIFSKVARILGKNGDNGGLMDAIYLGDILANGSKSGVFKGFDNVAGEYTLHTFLDKLIRVSDDGGHLLRSSRKVHQTTGLAANGKKGVSVGLIGLISNKSRAAAVGYRTELDAVDKLIDEGYEILSLAMRSKGAKALGEIGGTDIDIVCGKGGEILVVQVKISSEAHNLKKLEDWLYISTSDALKMSDATRLKDRLLRSKFMMPSAGENVNSDRVARYFRRTDEGKRVFLTDETCISFFRDNNLVIDMESP